MPSNVYDILNVARVEGGYEDRIPEIDQTNLHELSLLPPETLNEFIGVLTKIVKQYVYDTTFDESDNPFAAFFQEKLPVGGSVEDLYVDLITGDIPAWDDDGSVALSRKKPTVQELYHNHNYEMQYKVSTSFVQARTAFLTEGGVNSLLNRIKGTMNSSAQYDLYLQCLELLSTAITNGAMKEKSGYSLDSEAGIKTFLKDLKLVVKDFKFMNSKYNYYGYTTKTPAEDIIIITKPKYLVKIDVDYLAGVFNLDKAELKGRIIEVPDDYGFGQFDREGSTKEVIAVVMDKRMFRIFPEVFEGGAIYNPASLVTNSFLTLCYIFSYGLFFNAVYFTAEESPEPPTPGTKLGVEHVVPEAIANKIEIIPATTDTVDENSFITVTIKYTGDAEDYAAFSEAYSYGYITSFTDVDSIIFAEEIGEGGVIGSLRVPVGEVVDGTENTGIIIKVTAD